MNALKFWFLFALIIGYSMVSSSGSRILLSAPIGSKSQQNFYIPLMNELVRKGHSITFLTNYESKFLNNTVRQIAFNGLTVDTSKSPNPFHYQNDYSWSFITDSMRSTYRSVVSTVQVAVETVYNHPEVTTMIANETFDLVIVSTIGSPVSFPLAWHFKTPVILLSPGQLFTGTLVGIEENYSYVPFLLTTYSDRMSLKERVVNWIISTSYELLLKFQKWSVLGLVRQYQGFGNCPPIEEIERTIDLALINSNPLFHYPRSLPPNVIEISGPHCRPPGSLSSNTDLESFVSGSEAGFVVFSIGSYHKMDEMPERVVKSFMNAFSRFPLHRFVWQWNDNGINGSRPDFPENVLPLSWLPQQDLLGHEKCRLFITHGGLNGLQEAVYHGVPVLGLPLTCKVSPIDDQTSNILRATRIGYALKLDWKDVTDEILYDTLYELLYNTSYLRNVKKISKIYRDQMETPLERGVFWTEYVLRHNGSNHFKSLESKDLTNFQRNLVDVHLLQLVVFGVISIALKQFYSIKLINAPNYCYSYLHNHFTRMTM